MLVLMAWAGSSLTAAYVQQANEEQLDIFFTSLWTAWTLFASLTGKDLSWQIHRERILVLPSPGFPRLYALTFALGFLSLPLILSLFVALFWAHLKNDPSISSFFAVSTGHLLFVSSVQLSASLVRAALHGSRFMKRSLKSILTIALVIVAGGTLSSILNSGIKGLHPGHLLNLLIWGEQYLYPLACMGVWVILLILVDFIIQRDLVYSGIHGPQAPNCRAIPHGIILLFHPGWPNPIFRIGVLGWLRSRSALLLFVWGTAYSFLWTYFSKPDEVFYFFLFIWMNLLFHSYLRGNLLGTDRAAAWIYYMFPIRIECALSSKSGSLSLLQVCMVASLIAAGILQSDSVIDPAAWGRISTYAVSGILYGEICGFFLSIKFPDAIDRTSQFDGGMSVGALIVPVLQILFLFLFILVSGYVRQIHIPVLYWGFLLAVPLSLLIARFALLSNWVRTAMLQDREIILKKLAG
jgi:hypothetical protein